MAKKDAIEVEGKVVELLPNTMLVMRMNIVINHWSSQSVTHCAALKDSQLNFKIFLRLNIANYNLNVLS